MNPWIIVFLLLVVLTRARATENFGTFDSTTPIHIDVRIVAVPISQALVLVPMFSEPETFPQADNFLNALLARGEAELLSWPRLETLSGHKAISESIQEVLYPTEFEYRTPPNGGGLVDAFANPSTDPKFWRDRQRFPNLPPAFQTRNVGATLSAEPVYDGKVILLNIECKFVGFLGMEWGIGSRQDGWPDYRWRQPRFTDSACLTSLALKAGGHALLGVHVGEGTPSRTVLFLVHSDLSFPP